MSRAFIQKIGIFTPTQISGCQLWLDGADATTITQSGGTMSQWRDKSQNNNNSTSCSATFSSSINGNTVITNPTISGPITNSGSSVVNFFIVGTLASTGGLYSSMLALNAATVTNYYAAGTLFACYYGGTNPPQFYSYMNGNLSLSSTGAVNTPFIFNAFQSGTTGTTFFNGNSQGAVGTAGNTFTYTNYYIGAIGGAPAWVGNIAEIVVYNTLSSDSQRQSIEGYLAQKWGLVSSLPAGHPGRSQTFYTKNPGIAAVPSKIMTYNPYFAPITFTGCQLWLDGADTSTVTGTTTVTQWRDKSGNAYNGTVVNASVGSPVAPSYLTNSINGLPAITMSGTSYFTGSTNVNSTTLTAFFLGNCVFGTGGSSQQRILGLGVTGLDDYSSTLRPIPLSVISGGTQLLAYRNANMASATVVSGTNFIGCCLFDGTTNFMYKDGTLGTQTASSGTFTTSIYGVGSDAGTQFMGGTSSLGTNCLVGKIGELIVYNTALNTSQRQQVEGYLAWKWGLTGSLPANHPFKSMIPGRPAQVAGIPLVTQITHPTVPGYLEFYQVTSNDWTTSWLPYLQKLSATNTGATASSTLGTITGTSVGFYVSSFLAPNGLIYLADNQNNPMGVITPTANGGTYSSTTVTGVGPATQYGDNYKGGGLASNGIIYLVNFGAPGIGTINTNTNVFTTNPFNVSPGSAAVAGGVLGPDGNIYCAPYVNLSQLFYFTPGANTINSFAISATVRYSKPFLAPNGKIYCLGQTKIVGVIDPIGKTFTEVGTAANQQYGFMVLGGNGVVYAFPQNASGIGTLNLTTNAITANVIAGGTGYYGGILGPDGNIYLYQSSAGNIGILNTKTNSLSVLTSTSIGYICGVLAPNGNIYLGASSVIVFSGVSLIPTLNFCLTPYLNNGANRF